MKKSLWIQVLILCAAASGCTWDDSDYKTYVAADGNVTRCAGICESKNLQNGVLTDEAVCKALKLATTTEKDKTFCRVESEDKCKSLKAIEGYDDAAWKTFDLTIMSIEQGRFLRKLSTGEYVCGEYETILSDENKGEKCKKSDIDLFERSARKGLCPVSAAYCVALPGAASALADIGNPRMCSVCGADQVVCSGTCVNLFESNENCGACGTVCGPEAMCEKKVTDGRASASCVPRCKEDQTACVCEKKEGGSIECHEFQSGDTAADLICLDAGNSQTCGAESCEDLANAENIACKSGFECQKNSQNQYTCVCAEGTFAGKDGECIDPKNDATCGATETSAGFVCDQTVSMCRDGKCVCLGNKVACKDKDNQIRCVDPASTEYCGLKADPNYKCEKSDVAGVGTYVTCGENSVCANGVCRCADGFASCGETQKCESYMPKSATEPLMDKDKMYYCGAKGSCSSDKAWNADFKGINCLNTFGCRLDDSTAAGVSCICDTGLVLCNGDCIDPAETTMYCGANESCTEYKDCTLGGKGQCRNGKCECKETGEIMVWMDNKYQCVNPKTTPTCCGTMSDTDGKTVCKSNCLEDDGSVSKICKNGSCSGMCTPSQIECNGYCIETSQLNELHVEVKDNGTCVCVRETLNKGTTEKVTGYLPNGTPYRDYCDTDNNMQNGCEAWVNDDMNCGKCVSDAKQGEIVNCSQDVRTHCNAFDEGTSGNPMCVCAGENETYCDIGGGQCINFDENHMASCTTCKDGFVDGDGDLTAEHGSIDNSKLGCEIELNNDSQNCGSLNHVCTTEGSNATSAFCTEGRCQYDCRTGYGDCDTTVDGCETKLHDNNEHCMYCGNVCQPGQVCTDKGCKYDDGQGCSDCTLIRNDCKDGLMLWRRCKSYFILCVNYSNDYKCSSIDLEDGWEKV